MTKLSDKQTKFLNEAAHLGLETHIVEIPGRVVLVIKEPVDHSPRHIDVTAEPSRRGHTNIAAIYTYENRRRLVTLKEAGLTMLEWVGR